MHPPLSFSNPFKSSPVIITGFCYGLEGIFYLLLKISCSRFSNASLTFSSDTAEVSMNIRFSSLANWLASSNGTSLY